MCDGRRPGGAGEVIRLLEKPHQSDVTVLPIIDINIKMRVKALDETRILAPADLKTLVSFPRYGRLKLELLFERILHVRFRFCSSAIY